MQDPNKDLNVQPLTTIPPNQRTLWTQQNKKTGKKHFAEVRARILGLEEGKEATQEDFDSSPGFQLR